MQRVKLLKAKTKGFTLIELLVTIAIISILAAILFPVFARARENARRASCLSNLKQIGLATMTYTQDYDENYPPYLNFQSGTPDGGWVSTLHDRWFYQNMLYPYTKSMQVFHCPSGNATEFPGGHYGINQLMMPQDEGISMAGVTSPSTTYLIMDSGVTHISLSYVLNPGGSKSYVPGTAASTGLPEGRTSKPITDPWALNDYQHGRHFEGVNVTFADGHVKWLKSNVVYDEAKKSGSPAWNPAE